MSCKYKIIKVVGNAGNPKRANRTIAVPVRKSKTHKPSCNCYKLKGKHHKSTCATIPNTKD